MRLSKILASVAAVAMVLAIAGPVQAYKGHHSVGSAPDLELEVIEAMTDAIQDEYKAETTYQKVIDQFGSVRPFVNIIRAEQTHQAALARLFERHGLPVPANEWSVEDIPDFASCEAAAEAAVQAEIENAELYDAFFELDLPPDVERVFTNLQRASEEKHLPAFERAAEEGCGSCGSGSGPHGGGGHHGGNRLR